LYHRGFIIVLLGRKLQIKGSNRDLAGLSREVVGELSTEFDNDPGVSFFPPDGMNNEACTERRRLLQNRHACLVDMLPQ
jgi:hypothetical protein